MNWTHTEYRIGFGIDYDRHGNRLEPTQVDAELGRITHHAAIEFGGHTLVPVSGGWVNPDGGLVKENGRTLIVLVEGGEQDDRLAGFAQYIGRRLDQHSVVLSRGEHATIIPITY